MLEIRYLIFIFYFEQPTKSQKIFVYHYFSTWLTFLKKVNTRKKVSKELLKNWNLRCSLQLLYFYGLLITALCVHMEILT
jgi:hypothetical protein